MNTLTFGFKKGLAYICVKPVDAIIFFGRLIKVNNFK
jgi:hypothetical protein